MSASARASLAARSPRRQSTAGAKFGLCVNHVPGNTTLDLDCLGYNDAFKAAGGNSKVLIIQFSDASNPTFVTNAIKGALQADTEIDAIWTIGALQAVASVEAVKQTGRKVVNGSLGLSLGSLEALKNGDLLFIADLQPYLDGYYALLAAYQYVKYKMLPLGQISTGPLMITKDNVDEVLKVNEELSRACGAPPDRRKRAAPNGRRAECRLGGPASDEMPKLRQR